MNATLALPPVPLRRLREKTKDYLLGMASANGMTPEQVIARVLDRAADAQMPPPPPLSSTPQPEPEGDDRKAALVA